MFLDYLLYHLVSPPFATTGDERCGEGPIAPQPKMAQIKALAAKHSLEDYTLVANFLRGYSQWNAESAKVKIFLDEGLLDEAIAVVDNFRCDARIIHLVIEATTHRSK